MAASPRAIDLRRFGVLLLIGVCAVCGEARTIRVPRDCATIQTAFDSLGNGDTVLVAVGVYAEALVAPPLAFVLRGDVVPGPGVYPRPIVDPSALPGSDSLACLVLPIGSQPVIEDMKFRNSPQMYPRRRSGDYGGIRCSAAAPVFRRCLIDSVYGGLRQDWDSPEVVITLEHCLFRNDSLVYVRVVNSIIRAEDCLFSGRGSSLLRASDNSSFVRCRFRDNDAGNLLVVGGSNIEIRDCVFGPYGPFGFAPLMLSHIQGGTITGNLFTQCQVGAGVVYLRVDSLHRAEISGNVFLDNRTIFGQGSGGLLVQWDTGFGDGTIAALHDNTFVRCQGILTGNALYLTAGTDVRRNRFFHMDTRTAPVARVHTDSALFRENLFWNTGVALENAGIWPVDARWNWWGDSTGPYHASFNPEGRGDEVQGDVLIDPWYPDTSFLRTERELRWPAPQAYALNAYPNPFNAAAHIALDVPEAGIFRVEVFDVLGRRVRELYWGPVGMRKELVLDGSALTSGVYFIRATDTILNRPVAAAKVVLLK